MGVDELRAGRQRAPGRVEIGVRNPIVAPEENLTNTTMETYLQDRPSSCMACHQSVSNAYGRDFVGILASFR